ncbi:MAG: preprotein translocase subunit SecG [Puniceicoccales bacterium]|nr:preprotein translocase subunit SecG [Puniceicoccales bacterium]
MFTFFIVLLSIALLGVSAFAVLLVLMQRSPEGGGFGSALGSGAVESVFGGDAGDVLIRGTAKAIGTFFLLSLLLSLCYVHRPRSARSSYHLPTQLATPHPSDAPPADE